MYGAKVDIEKFNERNNFGDIINNLRFGWSIWGKDELPETTIDAEIDVLMRKTRIIILLNLLNEVLIEVIKKKDAAKLCEKLQDLYVCWRWCYSLEIYWR